MKKLTFDIYIISRLTHIYYTRELRKIGLSFGEFPFLISVYENEGISQEELSSLLIISKSTTATMIRKLADAGYVRKETDPADKRNFRLYITEEGLKFIPEIRRIIDSCHEKMTAGMTVEEKSDVCRKIKKIRQKSENSGMKNGKKSKKTVKNLSE
ncbi:MAG: MarR family transcriptional regulator [Lentisphaeria bacterium]|nr:MarR family transcriptional regulator [Lentisphaeria bacterium]